MGDFDINISGSQLINFIAETTVLREKYKFEYTKNLSLALEMLSDIGEEIQLSRKELSLLRIEDVINLDKDIEKEDVYNIWYPHILGQSKISNYFNKISFPSLLFESKDFDLVKSYSVKPNFITSKIIRAELLNLNSLPLDRNYNINGKIVLIENADPGYDWIFLKNIKGLITKYGGAASHMAIRSTEFGIPSVIGCGDILYRKIESATILEIDCKSQKINFLGVKW